MHTVHMSPVHVIPSFICTVLSSHHGIAPKTWKTPKLSNEEKHGHSHPAVIPAVETVSPDHTNCIARNRVYYLPYHLSVAHRAAKLRGITSSAEPDLVLASACPALALPATLAFHRHALAGILIPRHVKV